MKSEHYHSLDGLRGLAALSVVFLHYALAFAPFLVGYELTQRHTPLDHAVATTPLQLPIAGNFAVCIFFVLSGFVLSIKFFKTRESSVLTSSAARRFFRLFIPAFGSVLLAYAVVKLGGIYAHQAGIAGESRWFQLHWNFPAHIGQALFQGVYGIWFGSMNFKTSYNPVLWTMHYELFGSFLVFMFMALFGKAKNRWIFYAAFGLIFLKGYYLAFVAGMAICDAFINSPDIKEKLSSKALWLALPVGLVLGTWTTDTVYPTVYKHIGLPFFTTPEVQVLAHTIGAIIMVLAVLRISVLANLLSTRPLQYLGRISFSLYLTHFVVMSSLASYLFMRIEPAYGYKVAILVVPLLGIGISLALAGAYTKWVDEPSIMLSRRIGGYLLGADISKDLKKKERRLARRLRPAKRPIAGVLSSGTED